MNDEQVENGTAETPTPPETRQTIYMVPRAPDPDDDLTVQDVIDLLVAGKWVVVLLPATFAVLAMAYALLATEWYRSEMVLAPATTTSAALPALPGALGMLGGLAGITVGGAETTEAIAIVRSRDFARKFIEERGLLTTLLYKEWDAEAGKWIDEDPENQPDIRDAVRSFRRDVLYVSEDAKTGLVTIAVEWLDAEIAANWASDITRRLNDDMRQRALQEAEANVEYLKEQLSTTTLATLRQSIGAVLETELQKLMLAKGNQEFAFTIIDDANIPKRRVRPRRTLIVLGATAVGFILAFVILYLRQPRGERRKP